MPTPTLYMAVPNPTVGGDSNTWGASLNTCITAFDTLAVHNVFATSSTGTLGIFNGPVLVEATSGGGGITLTLPDATVAANKGRCYVIVKVDNGAGAVSIGPHGGQTISGQASIGISTQWNGFVLVSDGANWVVTGVISSDVSGILSVSEGGTGSNLSTTGGANQVLMQTTVGGNITVAQLSFSNISGTISGTQIAAATITVAMLASVEGNGTKVQLTSAGVTTANDVVTYDGSGNVQDSGVLLTSLAPLASPTFTGTVTIPTLKVTTAISEVNGLTTVANGVGAIVVKVDLATQSAAISGSSLFASTPAAGAYRISWSAVVTTPDGTSSTLGGSTGFQVTYTSSDTSGSVTTPAAGAPAPGTNTAYSQTNQDNTTGTQASGVVHVNATSGSLMTFSFGYTSNTPGQMVFAIHVRVEYLG